MKKNSKTKQFKAGDFIKCQTSGTRHWIGIVVMSDFFYYSESREGMRVTLTHVDGYDMTATFPNQHVYSIGLFYKFKPTKKEIEQIKRALNFSLDNDQIDNLSYIFALDKLNEHGNYKTRK